MMCVDVTVPSDNVAFKDTDANLQGNRMQAKGSHLSFFSWLRPLKLMRVCNEIYRLRRKESAKQRHEEKKNERTKEKKPGRTTVLIFRFLFSSLGSLTSFAFPFADKGKILAKESLPASFSEQGERALVRHV